jgi:hypothetical protein
MEAIGFAPEFVHMTKLLFNGTTASVCMNGTPSKPFPVTRDVRQGCPVAPYLFLLVGEVLNIQFQQAAQAGNIRGIKLPTVHVYQLISQYVDDTTIFLKGEERYVNNSIVILDHFCSASGLLINWMKSAAFWQYKGLPRPAWTNNYQWTWALPGEMSKLLGTPFGLNLASRSVDNFLVDRTKQKLTSWYASKLHISGRVIITNNIILASTLFFLVVWPGTVQAIMHIRKLASYFLWAGRETRTLARVAWPILCHRYRDGGLGIIDLEQAMMALMSKWIILALQPGNSNVQLMLRYRLLRTQPTTGANWTPDPRWAMLHTHCTRPGSKVWIRIGKAWKSLVKELSPCDPSDYYSTLNQSLWFEDRLQLICTNLSRERAAELFRARMKTVKDVWCFEYGYPLAWEEIILKFPLIPEDRPFWRHLISSFPRDWSCKLSFGPLPVKKKE